MDRSGKPGRLDQRFIAASIAVVAFGMFALLFWLSEFGRQPIPIADLVLNFIAVVIVFLTGAVALARHRILPRPALHALGLGLLVAAILETPHLFYLAVSTTQSHTDWHMSAWCALSSFAGPTFLALVILAGNTRRLRRRFLSVLKENRPLTVGLLAMTAAWAAVLLMLALSPVLLNMGTVLGKVPVSLVVVSIPTGLLTIGVARALIGDRNFTPMTLGALLAVTIAQGLLLSAHAGAPQGLTPFAYALRAIAAVLVIMDQLAAAASRFVSEAEERTRLGQTLDNIFDGVMTLSPEGNILTVNRACRKILGFDPTSGEPVVITNLVVGDWLLEERESLDDDITLFGRFVDSHLAPDGNGVMQRATRTARVRRADGSTLPVELELRRLTRLHEDSYILIVHDITVRVQAQEDLRERNRMIRLTQRIAASANEAETLHEAVARCLALVGKDGGWSISHALDTDEDGSLQSMGLSHVPNASRDQGLRAYLTSGAGKTGTDLACRAATAKAPVMVWHGQDSQNMLTAPALGASEIASAIALPILVHGQVRVVLEFYGRKLGPPDDTMLEIAQFVSGQLARVIERQDDAQRLRAARDEANRANREKSDLLASMSHELRTPLNAVLGFAQMLERDKQRQLDDESRDVVAHILSNGRHLSSMINDILDVARISNAASESTTDKSHRNDAAQPSAPAGPGGHALSTLSIPRKVLYVEDNPANALLLKMAFQPFAKVIFQIAEDAERGLDMMIKDPPDLVLMDLNLPGMNGDEALACIRADKQFDRIPVYVVSAVSEDMMTVQDLRFDGVIPKPLDIARSLDMVASVLLSGYSRSTMAKSGSTDEAAE